MEVKTMYTTATLALALGLLLSPVNSDAKCMGQGRGNCPQAGMTGTIANLPVEELSAVEEENLIKMRKEEKLARDVYQVLYTKWGLPVFDNIAGSEQRHMDSVKVLLNRYNLANPAADSSAGIFQDAEFQQLYDTLVEKGNNSLVDALQVGATIEDLNIKDLQLQLTQTDNADIKSVYQNLLKGSRNHMRSFSYQLSLQDASYEARYLTPEELKAIVSTPRERGMVDQEGQLVAMINGRGCEKSQGKRKHGKCRQFDLGWKG